MKDWQRLVGLLLDAAGDEVAGRGHPIWVRVLDSAEGDSAEAFGLAVSDEREGLLGWEATGDCQAVGVVATGRLRPLPGGRPDVVDHLSDQLRMACLLSRDGEVAWKMALPDGSTHDEAPSEGRLLDCLRRCFGLPTPPPPASPARLQAVAWLVAIQEQTRRSRRPLSWSEVARLHPVAQVLETDIGRSCPTPQPGLQRMAGSAWSWEDFRRRAQGGGLEDIIDSTLAGWMDEGMFARWVLSDLPSPDELLRSVRPYLAPSAARRLGHAVQSSSLPHHTGEAS